MKQFLLNTLPRWKIPLFYLGLLILNYGIYLPWWGLYGDDWQYLYSYHLTGAGGYPAFVAPDRPLSAWVYMLFTPLLGETPLAYHLLLLLLRGSAALLLWMTFKNLWPAHEEPAFWAGAVLIIYPGFRQQPLPLEFILHFSVLNLTLLSLYCMLRAGDAWHGAWKWTAAAIVSAFGIFSVEYFVGLEIIRPLLLWIKLKERVPGWRQRLRSVLLRWLPYLGVLAFFVFWRVFIFQFQHYKPSQEGLANPVKFLVITGWKALDSLWLALAKSWSVQINLDEGLPAAFAQVGVLAVSAMLVYLILRRIYIQSPADQATTGQNIAEMALVGAATLLLAGPLYWILNIPIQQTFPWERPLLSFIPGTAVLIGGLVARMFVPRYRSLILAALCALAMLANYQNARTFISEWHEMRSYVDQLTRRIPQVEPGTMLLTQNLPFRYYGENTFFPLLNWVYQPENRTPQMHLRMFDLSIRLNEMVQQLENGQTIPQNYRSFRFESDREHVIAILYQPPACLKLLEPGDGEYPNLPNALGDLLYMSNPSLVMVNAQRTDPLPPVLGGPIPRSWCSLYADAELARQKQDWEAVQRAADQAQELGLRPMVGYEYLPFLEAFARSGDWERVDHYFAQANSMDREDFDYLCDRWETITAAFNPAEIDPKIQAYCSD